MRDSLTYIGLAFLIWCTGVGILETWNKIHVGAATRPFIQEVLIDPNADVGVATFQAPPPGRRR